jgi:hypothetical protein
MAIHDFCLKSINKNADSVHKLIEPSKMKES